MDAEELYKPLVGRLKRPPTRRQYLWGGIFCAAMAVGSVAVEVGWVGTVTLSLLALGSFRLAARQQEETISPPGSPDA